MSNFIFLLIGSLILMFGYIAGREHERRVTDKLIDKVYKNIIQGIKNESKTN